MLRRLSRISNSLILTYSLVAAALLAFNAWTSHQSFVKQQHQTIRASAQSTARQITALIDRLRSQAQLFAEQNADTIRALTADPDNQGQLYVDLMQRLRQFFPELFTFTLADADGEPILGLYDFLIDDLAIQDMKRFAESGDNSHTSLHYGPTGDNFEIMVPWIQSDMRPGVFFLSFQPKLIQQILIDNQTPGEHLLLMDAALADRIDFTTEGAGTEISRERWLNETEEQDTVIRLPIQRTDWVVTALPNQQFFDDTRAAIMRQSGMLFAALVLVGALTLYWIGRAADRQRTAETRLAENEIRFAQLFSEIHNIAVRGIDAEGRVIFWNLAAEAIYGHSIEDAVGQPVDQLIAPPEQRQSMRAQIRQWYEHDQPPPDGEQTMVNKYGQPVHVLSSHAMLRNSRGQREMFSIDVDLSEQKLAEQELRLAATVFENTTEGIFITDPKGNIISVNQAFLDITGYHLSEVLGENPRLLKSDRHDPGFYKEMWATLMEDGFWLGEIWNRRKNGELFPAWEALTLVRGDDGEITHYVAAFSDVTDLRKSQRKLDYLAHHDLLTGLPNRLLVDLKLRHAMQEAQLNDTLIALLFLDLDGFQHINDSFGHAFGDRVLKDVAKRICNTVGEKATVARLGGDEFLIVVPDIVQIQEVSVHARRLLDSLDSPMVIDQRELYMSGSIGICLYPRDGDEVDTLLRNADSAMYRAKAQGRSQAQFYSADFTREAQRRVQTEAQIQQALANDEFEIYFQPQVELASGRLVGAEALVRWQHPEKGLLSPYHFVPLAEQTGQIKAIGEWMLLHACRHWVKWHRAGHTLDYIAVNLAGHQVTDPQLVERVSSTLSHTGCPASRLELEITENLVMKEIDATLLTLNRLGQLGVQLSIDDFGTGHSSLEYLKRLPVNKLKIDRSFVMDLIDNPQDQAITRTVIDLGKGLGLEVIAEGVEEEAQKAFLAEAGCDQIQGYLLDRPLPAHEFESRWLGMAEDPAVTLNS